MNTPKTNNALILSELNEFFNSETSNGDKASRLMDLERDARFGWYFCIRQISEAARDYFRHDCSRDSWFNLVRRVYDWRAILEKAVNNNNN